jgi:hypothetical protein
MGDRIHWTGSVIGTGSAIDVKKVGFRPRMVRIFNVSTACQAFWNKEMPDAAAYKVVGATGVGSYVSAGGITSLANGFTIGADANINTNGGKLVLEAFD